jgi:enediyne polyketide synthase
VSSPIAIVGSACRYPDASSVDELFENSLAQRRAFREIPRGRISADYFDESGLSVDRAYTRQAAVIKGFEFDREWFRVARQSFDVTDITHWLALTVARETVEDVRFRSGHAHPHNDSVRVVVANTLTGEFSRASLLRLRWPYVRRIVAAQLRRDNPDLDEADLARRLRELEASFKAPFPAPNEDFLAGGLANTIAGRICNHFDFKGGGYSIDGACASSLLAVSDACSALAAGDADMVLAGGVDVSLDPFELVGFSRSAALAKQEMLVYDEQSEGFWPGEGCGFVALMRYSDAVEQCERIHGVIHGWGISSDGRGGLTRPESAGQQLALERCYARAGYGIESVGYFEGHGTGTSVGDAAELDALITARRAGRRVQQAVISSIKANIGHTKAAAGLAGLLRATKCVSEHVLPPTTACRRPHRLVIENADNLMTSPQLRPWSSGDGPRRAGISSMGFGGINTHVTIEEVPGRARSSITLFDDDQLARLAAFQDAELFLFAAATQGDLAWTIDRISGIAGECSRSELTDLAIELARRATRDMLRTWKAAVVASTPVELSQRLERLLRVVETADDDVLHLAVTDGVFLSGGARKGAVGLVFPGQGAPARHTGGIHARRFREVEATYARGDLRSFTDRSDTDFAQPAIVTASVAGLQMLQRIGAIADVAVGHSLGELTALHWAGHFDHTTLIEIARARGLATMNDALTSGAMAAIAADQDETARLIGDDADVVVANLNAPRQTIVSGSRDGIESLLVRATRQGTAATMLNVRRAFHSPAMAGVAARFGEVLDDITFGQADRKVISTVTGDVLTAGTDLAGHLCDQLVKPVQFLAAIRAAERDVDLFVEVGPGNLMADLIASFTTTPVVSLDVGGESMAPYLHAAGAMFVLDRAQTIAELFVDRFARKFDWNWKPKFFENRCEAYASDGDVALDLDPEPTAVDAARGEPLAVDRSASSRDQVRRAIADHTGLPAWTFEDGSRMSSDLHLNSITVSEIVVRLAVARGLLTPVDPTEYANASIAEIADALDSLEEVGTVASDDCGASARGIANWVRNFEVGRAPARPLVRNDDLMRGVWEVFGVVTPQIDELLQRLNDEPLGNGVILWLATDPCADDLSTLLAAARRCLERRRSSGDSLLFVVVQHGWGAGGFARSFFLEERTLDVLVINLPVPEPDQTAEWIVREIAAFKGGFDEVVVDESGGREETRVQLLEAPSTVAPLVDERDVVLVTGGGKGISAECGFQLARRTGCALLILGRSQPEESPELANNLERLRQAGVRVSYQLADVTDPAAVLAATAAGTAELGSPVTGLIHGAGLNHPRTVGNMTVANLESTLAPKLDGLRNVLASVDPHGLKLLCTFSSIIARIGLPGEADYALGNEWLSHETEEFKRSHPHCRCRAIEWSVWSGTGMGQRLGRLDALTRQGIAPLSIDDGVAEFLRLIDAPDLPTRVIVSGRFGSPRTLRFERPARLGYRFVDSVLVDYPGIEFVAECELSTDSDPYLNDHVLDGGRLFPAVMALEAMTEATAALLGRDAGTFKLQFCDVAFRAAIIVPTPAFGRLAMRVVALAHRDGEISLSIRCSSTEFLIDHVEARCRIQPAEADLAGAPPLSWADADLDRFEPDRSLYGNVLFQRGRFMRIESYQMIEARRCRARLSADGATQWFAPDLPQVSLLGDAGARDAALHAIQACIPHKVVIPVAVEQIDAGRLDPSKAYQMYAEEVADRGEELVYDLTIIDAELRPVEHWRNVVLRVAGQLPHLRLDSPLLMAPSLERRVAACAPDAGVRVRFVSATDEQRSRKGRIDPAHRPDGKQDRGFGNGRFHTAAYAGGWRLAVDAESRVGCDVECVSQRNLDEWQSLLDPEGFKLASVVGKLVGEPVDVSATRIWTVKEAMKKAGFSAGTPMVVDPESEADWVVIRSGTAAVYSCVIAARGAEPAMCVATALVDS